MIVQVGIPVSYFGDKGHDEFKLRHLKTDILAASKVVVIAA